MATEEVYNEYRIVLPFHSNVSKYSKDLTNASGIYKHTTGNVLHGYIFVVTQPK